jgi:hypothetical protein
MEVEARFSTGQHHILAALFFEFWQHQRIVSRSDACKPFFTSVPD